MTTLVIDPAAGRVAGATRVSISLVGGADDANSRASASGAEREVTLHVDQQLDRRLVVDAEASIGIDRHHRQIGDRRHDDVVAVRRRLRAGCQRRAGVGRDETGRDAVDHRDVDEDGGRVGRTWVSTTVIELGAIADVLRRAEQPSQQHDDQRPGSERSDSAIATS